VRRSRKLDFFIVAAIGVLVAVAAADALRSRGSSPDIDRDAEVLLESEASAGGSPNERVQGISDRWASSFARGSCEYMTQPLCERLACERVGGHKIKNCTPVPRAYRKSFDGAIVSDVAFNGDRAAAWFSNGEAIELCCDGGGWMVTKVGGNAGRGFSKIAVSATAQP
jgi:hypothetical protein